MSTAKAALMEGKTRRTLGDIITDLSQEKVILYCQPGKSA